MRPVVWSDEAIRDVDAIRAYLNAEAGPRVTERMVRRIKAAADSLDALPERGRRGALGTRRLVHVRPFVIRYRVLPDEVRIIAVRHGAMRPVD